MTPQFRFFLAAVAFVAIVFCTAAYGLERKDNTLIFSPEEVALCEAQGGCVPISKVRLIELLNKAYAKGVSDTKVQCRNFTDDQS